MDKIIIVFFKDNSLSDEYKRKYTLHINEVLKDLKNEILSRNVKITSEKFRITASTEDDSLRDRIYEAISLIPFVE